MKASKLLTLLTVIILTIITATTAVNAANTTGSRPTGNYTLCEVKPGNCILADNESTNHQASDYAICFAEAYGVGRTTYGDAIIFENVQITGQVSKLVLRCGYNLGSAKAGTGTEFYVYLNSISGSPVAKFAVNDRETKSAQKKDQVYKYADVSVNPGTYNVIIIAASEYSGSCSELFFLYGGSASATPSAPTTQMPSSTPVTPSAPAATTPAQTTANSLVCTIKAGNCTLMDNAATNHQVSNYALCFAEAYGVGRVSYGDAVIFKNVNVTDHVSKLSLKCGLNSGYRNGISTEYLVYLNSTLGAPVARFTVSNTETRSSRITDQIYKYADVSVNPGIYDVIIISASEYSGCFSELCFLYDGVSGGIPVTVPDFPIKINNKRISKNVKYPCIVYKGITYFPMTYSNACALGLSSSYTDENGLTITRTGISIGTPDYSDQGYTNGGTQIAQLVPCAVRINGKLIDNAREEYPLLVFRDITYFPLTWRFAVEEFGWNYYYSANSGLSINCQ